MKDYPDTVYEAAPLPSVAAIHAIDFCLQRLYSDRHHVREDEVSPGLSYRELIAALILSRDLIGTPTAEEEELDVDFDDNES